MWSSDRINKNTDFIYTGPESKNFPACCLCGSYSPFLCYVTSVNAMASLKESLHPKLNIFCVECLPRESVNDEPAIKPFYDMECLFNSPEILSLFQGFRYSNPYYEHYYAVDRILLTENTKISPRYKELMRKPLPKLVKVRKLSKLFDPVHRMRFGQHSDVVAVFQALRAKYLEILHFYENVSPADPKLCAMKTSNDSSSEIKSTVITQEGNDVKMKAVKKYEMSEDSQKAGHSGLDQQQGGDDEYLYKKRRSTRIAAMNPSPRDFKPKHEGVRLPRLHGG